MAGLTMRGWWLFVSAMAMILLLSSLRAQGEDICGGDLVKLEHACKEFVLIPGPPKDPSKECCDVIQHADIPCCCNSITKEIEKIISTEKMVYVSKQCERPLKSGSKCGSFTVPVA